MTLFHATAARLMCGFAAVLLSATAQAEPVAMVTDLEGRAELAGARVSILMPLEAGTRIQLAGGARLVLVYLKSGEEYAFRGPAAVEIQPLRPENPGGTPPQRRSVGLARGNEPLRVNPTGLTLAAIQMRGMKLGNRLRLLTLSDTQTLEAHPVFRWQPVDATTPYHVELSGDLGDALLETDVAGDSLVLPASITLQPGMRYHWSVSAQTADGRTLRGSGVFELVPPSVRTLVEQTAPPPGAPFSERVLFAAWLDQMRLHDEARRYWRDAARERPDDPVLKALGGW